MTTTLDHIPSTHGKVTAVVDQAIVYMLIRGTLGNFGKFAKLDGGKVTSVIVNDVATAKNKGI